MKSSEESLYKHFETILKNGINLKVNEVKAAQLVGEMKERAIRERGEEAEMKKVSESQEQIQSWGE